MGRRPGGVIVHNRADDPKEQLVVDLLKLALSKAGGEYDFRAQPEIAHFSADQACRESETVQQICEAMQRDLGRFKV